VSLSNSDVAEEESSDSVNAIHARLVTADDSYDPDHSVVYIISALWR